MLLQKAQEANFEKIEVKLRSSLVAQDAYDLNDLPKAVTFNNTVNKTPVKTADTDSSTVIKQSAFEEERCFGRRASNCELSQGRARCRCSSTRRNS